VKPNFLIIGAAKCGTTTLYDVLRQHPQIGMCDVKEPNYFGDDSNYARGPGWYESLFQSAAGKIAIGEASPQYTWLSKYPHASERIARDLPDARLIYSVRHPLDRMVSGYMMQRAAGALRVSLGQAVRRFPGLVEHSLYWKQISAYRTHFRDDRIRIVFLEDYARDPCAELRGLYEFLGVDPDFQAPDPARPRNARASMPPPPTDWMRRYQRSAMARVVRAVLSPGVRRGVRTLARRYTHAPVARPEWDEETRRWAVEQVLEDARQLLAHCGKPPDYWDLRPVVPAVA